MYVASDDFDPYLYLLGPGLAERWEVDDSKKVWTFHLRKGVKFSNGEPFDARSVKFTLERIRNPKIKARTTIVRRMALDRVEIVDDQGLGRGFPTDHVFVPNQQLCPGVGRPGGSIVPSSAGNKKARSENR